MVFALKGVCVPHRKHTADCKPVRMPIPKTVQIPLSMHIGAPATCLVKVGEHVDMGQKIAESSGFVSAPIHSSVSGTVKSIGTVQLIGGKTVETVVIEADGMQTLSPSVTPPAITDYDSFIAAVRESGSVGLGGASFPTAVKLAVKGKPLDAIVINGAECEPYITSDTRTMLDRKEGIFAGIELLQKYLAPKSIIFGIEKNKPACIAALKDGMPEGVQMKALPSVYPQGGEKVLIYHTTGKVVPSGKLPIDVGVVVINCTTLAFLGEYAKTGLPLIEKTVTVDGKAVGTPQNVIAPIGASAEDVFAFCGGLTTEPFKVLQGGPMMGVALPDLSMPIMKGTNALLALSEAELAPKPSTACIRCGACALHCPLKLDPRAFSHNYKAKDMEALEKGKLTLCMECGCCSFICPAARPLVEHNRLAKAELNAYLRKKKEEESK